MQSSPRAFDLQEHFSVLPQYTPPVCGSAGSPAPPKKVTDNFNIRSNPNELERKEESTTIRGRSQTTFTRFGFF